MKSPAQLREELIDAEKAVAQAIANVVGFVQPPLWRGKVELTYMRPQDIEWVEGKLPKIVEAVDHLKAKLLEVALGGLVSEEDSMP